jgi:hypothetical protein
MRSLALAVALACVLLSTQSNAQQELLGKYEAIQAGYNQLGGATQYWTLEITAVENGKLTGTMNVAKFECRGDYPIEGSYRDNKLEMRTVEGRRAGCGNVPMVLVLEGNKLIGTRAGAPIEFLKK